MRDESKEVREVPKMLHNDFSIDYRRIHPFLKINSHLNGHWVAQVETTCRSPSQEVCRIKTLPKTYKELINYNLTLAVNIG